MLRRLIACIAISLSAYQLNAGPPEVGSKVPDFTLLSITGSETTLSKVNPSGPIVLVVLRGYPGYQCPVCDRQVQSLISAAKDFQEASAHVVLVYPGPSDNLQKRAEEFVGNKQLPENFHLLLDPDYTFTNQYGLRWDAPRETAYPSTFVISSNLKVDYAKISKSHGGRAKTPDILRALGQ